MTHKTAQPVGAKPPKRSSNVVLAKSSSNKVQPGPNPISQANSHLHGATGAASAEKRQLMIAEAAYYIAERRGFGAGREMEDWLLGEQQVDALLSGGDIGAQAV